MKKLKITAINNLANLLTGIRILATFMVCYKIRLLLNGKIENNGYTQIAVLFLIIWISDIADGKVARKLKITSSFGAKFDVVADAIFVFALHILLATHHIVPLWFIVLMIEKILNYVVSSYIVSKKTNKSFDFIRDPLGKAVGVSYFLTPCLLLAAHMIGDSLFIIANAIIITISIIGICSSIYRITKTLQIEFKPQNSR